MAGRLAALLPRFVLLTLGFLLATATITFAAEKQISSTAAAKPASTAAKPQVVVVPNVVGQAYVFAKGTLEDAGFGWRVARPVGGYAANTVVSQQPAGGTRVVDTGAPQIVLQLARNKKYAQHGTPENSAPYAGTEIVLAGQDATRTPAAAKPKPTQAKPAA